MTTEERRAQLYALLAQAQQPLTGSALARRFGVSRQIIVGDIALLRAARQTSGEAHSACAAGVAGKEGSAV
mgnify:CR=1 FL=1